MAKVISINISEEKGVIKNPIEKGFFKKDFGLEGDAHGGNWHRQVSILAEESIDKMKELGLSELTPGVFAENITTKGIILYTLPIGTKLKMGEVVMEVTQIGKECHSGCQISKITGKCIMPKEGIFARILEEGYIQAGDEVKIAK
ncbi:MOSC domain-containing protein YiiM [Clostridium pascui]|uniref:MOSC domain-containing protein n=1 Tax=Clostridium pascui TaxID=46609 RepID=UPI0019578497|nr:MOSC domain-containing protein [Clostridium pascui]MBM7870948.1 MOSC domain-containing protein YiiM [Clostridium pascui]